MKTYSVNVHYDYCASVTVQANNEEEALEKAKQIADAIPSSKLEYCDYTDSCVTNIED